MKTAVVSILALIGALGPLGCSDDETSNTPAPRTPADFDPSTAYAPDVTAAELSADIDNDFFPLPVGATWTYQAETEDGTEEVVVTVTSDTKEVNGATARVVRDTASLGGEVIEDTFDWYAQDAEGNVWYLGEDTAEYENGEVVSREGSWEWGVDGAIAGVVMLAEPEVGDVYRQEYYVGQAEDYAEVIALDATVESEAFGTLSDCLKTHDLSALDSALSEFKYYCRGIGNVRTDEAEPEVLVSYTGL